MVRRLSKNAKKRRSVQVKSLWALKFGEAARCSIAKAERSAYAESVVLEALGSIQPSGPGPITPLTLLGPGGLGHGFPKRASYRAAILNVLNARGHGCALASLKTSDFKKDTLKKVLDVIALVEKDLV